MTCQPGNSYKSNSHVDDECKHCHKLRLNVKLLKMNWVRIFNGLFLLMNYDGPTRFSGSRYIDIIREFDPVFYSYKQYIEHRNQIGKSTNRKDYFYDILMEFDEQTRTKIVQRFLAEIKPFRLNDVCRLEQLLNGNSVMLKVMVNEDLWNADRLNKLIEAIDTSIGANELNRAVTLTYTALEGFLKAFYRAKIGQDNVPDEITTLARNVKDWLRGHNADLPNEVFNLFSNISHTIDKCRNGYSESHFDDEASRWMTQYLRDLLSSQIRLLLNFL